AAWFWLAALARALPFAGAAKLGDAPTRPMPKPTRAAKKIARIVDSPCVLKRRRPSASRGLAFGDRVLRSELGRLRRAFIRRSAHRQSPPTATTNAIGPKLKPCSQNNAWLAHSSLVHRMAWH